MLLRACVIAAAVCVLSAGCSTQAPSSGTNARPSLLFVGAGSTFDTPFFNRAFYEYSQIHPAVGVNYQSIGSGGGIRQFSAGTVDFGATDVPMSAMDLTAVPKGRLVIQIPITLGGVAIAYNVPDAPAHLKLSPALLADIFLGTINNWNDARIATLNPGVHFASLPIAMVHRADGSGTTYIVTDYLTEVSPEWKTRIGKGKTVSWPAPNAIGEKGTEGVAAQVRNTPGAIGYVELAYALQTNIPYAMLQNKSGAFVLPSIDTVAAAAASKPHVMPANFSIVDQPGRNAYPIAGYSWVLLYRHYPDATKQKALHDLFVWMLADGQRFAKAIDYVPLPPAVSRPAIATVNTMVAR